MVFGGGHFQGNEGMRTEKHKRQALQRGEKKNSTAVFSSHGKNKRRAAF